MRDFSLDINKIPPSKIVDLGYIRSVKFDGGWRKGNKVFKVRIFWTRKIKKTGLKLNKKLGRATRK